MMSFIASKQSCLILRRAKYWRETLPVAILASWVWETAEITLTSGTEEPAEGLWTAIEPVPRIVHHARLCTQPMTPP